MIAYRIHRGYNYPIILCDACGKQINDGHGNVYWLPERDGADVTQLWFTHKWPCANLDRQITEKTGRHCSFEELNVWLSQLTHNIQAGKTVPAN